MANIKSQKKRIRTNERARLRNQAIKSALRTDIRSFREAAEAGDKKDQDIFGDVNFEGGWPYSATGKFHVELQRRPLDFEPKFCGG